MRDHRIVDAELVQAYARGISRIVAAEAELARRTVPLEPAETYERRLEEWLAQALAAGVSEFGREHRRRLAEALSPLSAGIVEDIGTVAFVDLCNSTQFMLSCPPDDLRTLVDDLFFVTRGIASRHGVSVVKYLGDGAVLLAADPAAALAAAQELVLELGERTPLQAAGGVAHGRVLAHAGDCFGPAVNLASRLAELARANEVLVDLDEWPGDAPGSERLHVSARGLEARREICALRIGAPQDPAGAQDQVRRSGVTSS